MSEANAASQQPDGPQGPSFDDLVDAGMPRNHLAIEDLEDVRLEITADLGSCTMLVREILELQKGSIITLSKLAGEMSDVFVNGLPLARGEVVVIGDTLHVRVGEIIGLEEKTEEEPEEDYDDEEDY
jgi:flagellar motor switch protein FliN/FliY